MIGNPDRDIRTDKADGQSLVQLVSALPEVYQPIFSHPDLSAHVTRVCHDRLLHISQIYQNLASHLKRPVRVLDLGCAQGFFSLSLAKLGAIVHGVDLQECNILVCKALAAEHPELKVSFHKGLIEEVILNMARDRYDLVLGLSVFHHLVHIVGADIVQKMIAVLGKTTLVGIFELASAHEPTKRASSQPQTPKLLLSDYAFVHELAQHDTHLANSPRPLYVASNIYWLLDSQIATFETWKSESHAFSKGAYNGTRRYFMGSGYVAKQYMLDDDKYRDINLQEYRNEVSILSNGLSDVNLPKLFLHGQNEHEVWLVRDYLPGELLIDIMRTRTAYDAGKVIRDVLDELVALEKASLYHNDLRTWNILVGSDGGAHLIDYGAITTENKDRGWPYNLFLSFMIVLNEIIGCHLAVPDPIRLTAYNPENFPEPYRSMLWRLFEHEPEAWSFGLLRDSLLISEKGKPPQLTPVQRSFAKVIETVEDACKIHQSAAHQMRTAPKK
jgi:O-antigen chain-terminating methyltransferase